MIPWNWILFGKIKEFEKKMKMVKALIWPVFTYGAEDRRMDFKERL